MSASEVKPTSIFKVAKELGISRSAAVKILNEKLELESVVYQHSTLPAEVSGRLRAYVAANPALPTEITEKGRAPGHTRQKSAAKRSSGAVKKATKRVPAIESETSDDGKRWCPLCGASVTFGIVTGVVVRHQDRDDKLCSGSGLQKADTSTSDPKRKPRSEPAKRDIPAAKPKKKGRRKGGRSGGGSALGRARYEDEFGGANSVRTVRGGLPGLGRR